MLQVKAVVHSFQVIEIGEKNLHNYCIDYAFISRNKP